VEQLSPVVVVVLLVVAAAVDLLSRLAQRRAGQAPAPTESAEAEDDWPFDMVEEEQPADPEPPRRPVVVPPMRAGAAERAVSARVAPARVAPVRVAPLRAASARAQAPNRQSSSATMLRDSLRGGADLRRAVVLMAVLGPCKANEPPSSPS
jgi:hypothetical protein